MEIEIADIWTAGGVILGFHATSFAWRISQESQVGSRGDLAGLSPADYLNRAAMASMVVGVFLAPAMGRLELITVKNLFGLSTLLFLGHVVCAAAHYELFNPKTPRSFTWFPLQEKGAVLGALTAVTT